MLQGYGKNRIYSLTMNAMLTLCMAIGIFMFWFTGHPEALSFQEQYQMFLFTSSYFVERISVAGGLASYIAEFLTQFYYYPILGALIIASLSVGIQISIWQIAKRMEAKAEHYPLSLVVPLMLLIYMGDENVMLEFAIAISIALLSILGYTYITKCKWAISLITIPLLYWFIGPATIIYIIAASAYDIKTEGICKRVLQRTTISVIWWLLTLWLSAELWLVQYTWTDIIYGINYHRLRQEVPAMQTIIEAVAALLPVLASILPSLTKPMLITATETIIIAATTVIGVNSSYDEDKYEVIKLDYLVRSEKWDKIIQLAEQHMPHEETACTSINLALAMKDQLGDRMFDFYQCGPQGLLTPATSNQFTSLPTAEALLRIGMVNEAQNFFFDIQESIINYRKSCRCTKRLAEINIINGRYKVAEKYIQHLKKTLFYSDWANQAEKYLNDEQSVAQHPMWGKMRKYRFQIDFFSSYNNMDKMMGILYQTNNNNTIAYEYYIAQLMLLRDMQGLWNSVSWMKERSKTTNTPRHHQEAIALIWLQGHKDLNGIPVEISVDVQKRLNQFIKTYSAGKSNPQLNQIKNNYWYYALVSKTHRTNEATTGATAINKEQAE